MKMIRRMTAAMLSVLAVFLLLPLHALAAGSIDLNRNVSLTISYQDGNTALSGAQFDIFRVAAVDKNGGLTPTKAFSRFNVDLEGKTDEAWRALAFTLEGYVLRDEISPTDSGSTDQYGRLSFPNKQKSLAQGLYLVVGYRHVQGSYVYEAAPSIVMLPGPEIETGSWHYDVTVKPKCDVDPLPENPGTVTRKVLKVWEDAGHKTERPKKVVVQLLRNGKVYDTVTLDAGNNWRYTWTGLDSSYKWTLVEKELDDYTVTVTREGVTFVVTNTYAEDTPDKPTPVPPTSPDKPTGPPSPDKPTGPSEPSGPSTQPPTGPNKPVSKPTLPQTGQLWWPVPALIAAGLLLIVIGLLRRRGAGHEE